MDLEEPNCTYTYECADFGYLLAVVWRNVDMRGKFPLNSADGMRAIGGIETVRRNSFLFYRDATPVYIAKKLFSKKGMEFRAVFSDGFVGA